MQARISVVIPLYNKAAYVAEAVRSAFAQTHPPFEVIVVNDGSTDGSDAIVRALPYPNLRVIDIPNSGVSVARNTGIAAASGDHIAFLDADDFWSPLFLQAIQRLIDEIPGCSLYGTGSREVLTGQTLPPINAEQVQRAALERIDNFFRERARRVLIHSSSLVVPRFFFSQYGIRFAPGEAHGEDHDVWFLLAERAPIAYLGLPLSAYRRGVQQSLTSVFAWEQLEPAYTRLWERTQSPAYPEHLRAAAQHLVHRRQTSFARNRLVCADDRLGAFRLLFRDNHRPGASLFWWSTLIACLLPAGIRRRVLDVNKGWKDHPLIGRLFGRAIKAHPSSIDAG